MTPFPASPEAMRTLFALSLSKLAHITEQCDGRVWLEIDGKVCPIDLGEIDELERAGLVDMGEHDRITLTDRGRYWLERWKKQARKLYQRTGVVA